jgi:hypothetical protein
MAKSAVKSAPVPTSDVPKPPENKPVHVIHYASVRGLIHRSETGARLIHTFTCERVTHDKAHNEQVCTTFESGDLRMLAKVAIECLRWIEWQEKMHSSGKRPA